MSIHAALLPSLQATYCMQQVTSIGVTGSKAKFNVHLPTHHLAFSTKIQDLVRLFLIISQISLTNFFSFSLVKQTYLLRLKSVYHK